MSSTMLWSTGILTAASIASGVMVFAGHLPAPGIAIMLFSVFLTLLLINLFFDWQDYREHHKH